MARLVQAVAVRCWSRALDQPDTRELIVNLLHIDDVTTLTVNSNI